MTRPRLLLGTVRARLAAWYGALFLTTGAVLLFLVYLLQKRTVDSKTRVYVVDRDRLGLHGTGDKTISSATAAKLATMATARRLNHMTAALRADTLHELLLGSAITVGVLAVVGVAGGWWLAGRVLRPVADITATARRLSGNNLHERIHMSGQPDEFKSLADTFDEMLERLERSFESQRAFIANVSHELRNPLAAQRAAIQIGLTHAGAERLQQVREELLTANRRTERLIDGLLMLARGDGGIVQREPVRLDEVARTVAEAQAELARETGVHVRLDVAPTLVDGDPVLLTQLVTNLVHNAIRYNHPGGDVELTVTTGGEVRVVNTGPMVPEAQLDELFEPFHRLAGPRLGSDGGAGLGLSIVRSIACAHDATIAADARSGGGLDIMVSLSAVEAAPSV